MIQLFKTQPLLKFIQSFQAMELLIDSFFI